MEFELYININKNKYLIDINDSNINYHINVIGNSTVTTGTFDLDLYEKIDNIFNVNDIIYIKDIYNDTVIFIGKIMNITSNTFSILKQYYYSSNPYKINNMDQYIVNKVKNLENFNNINYNNNVLQNLIKNNIFVIDDMIFTTEDYLAVNNLG